MAKQFAGSLTPGTILQGTNYTYTIVRSLGQGSFGITYLARVNMLGSLGAIDVDVAVKEFFMHEVNGREGTSVTASNSSLFGKYHEKFRKESRNMSTINHRGVIRVLESFEANNTSYYVMEYISEGSLDDYIKAKGRLSEDETVELTRQIAEALGEIHAHKMLHLDLKPGNIMMAKGVRPVLIDFGLSKQFDDSGNPESSTTIGGGSPGYAPLEQSNYNRDTDNTVPVTMDIYALGATMFKMLTGRRAPEASSIFNDGFPEDALDAAGVSPEIKAVVMKAMAPARKNRYQSTAELLAALPKSHAINLTSGDDEEDKAAEETKLDEPNPVPTSAPTPTPTSAPATPTSESDSVKPTLESASPIDEPKSSRKKWLITLIICAIAILGAVTWALLGSKGTKPHANNKDEAITEEVYSAEKAIELAEIINNSEAGQIDDNAFDDALRIYLEVSKVACSESEKLIGEEDENKIEEVEKAFEDKYKAHHELVTALINAYKNDKLTDSQAKKLEDAYNEIVELWKAYDEKNEAYYGSVATSDKPLDNTSWLLAGFTDGTEEVAIAEDNDYILSFNGYNNTFSMTTDCNTLYGDYTVGDDNIMFDNLTSTLVTCLDASLETAMFDIMPRIDNYVIENSNHLILRSGNRPMATFIPMHE